MDIRAGVGLRGPSGVGLAVSGGCGCRGRDEMHVPLAVAIPGNNSIPGIGWVTERVRPEEGRAGDGRWELIS